MYKLRYLGQEEPERRVQKGYGNLYVMAVLGAVALVAIGGAVYLGVQAQSQANVTLSAVSATTSPCLTNGDPSSGYVMINYSFSLTNSGTRDAYAIVDLYGSGQVLGSTGPIRVAAGQTVPIEETAYTYACGPVTPTAAIRTVTPIP